MFFSRGTVLKRLYEKNKDSVDAAVKTRLQKEEKAALWVLGKITLHFVLFLVDFIIDVYSIHFRRRKLEAKEKANAAELLSNLEMVEEKTGGKFYTVFSL